MENTIAAFAQARRGGARAIELDVRTCRGGEAVVFHDASLPTTQGPDGVDIRPATRICDVAFRELRERGVPLLEEALSWARAAGVAVNVEMKHDVPDRIDLAKRTVRAVRAMGGDVLFSSFDPFLLAVAGALASATPRALLVHSGQSPWASALQRGARPPWVGAIHLERTQAHPDVIADHSKRGLRVGVWTVNDPDEAVLLAGLGVASIITDLPGVIAAALTRN